LAKLQVWVRGGSLATLVPASEAYARRLVKGSTIVFTALVLSGIIGLLLRMFLARNLSVGEYGLFYAIFALVGFFALFRDLGLNSALVKYIPEFSVRKEFGAIKSSIAFAALFQAVFAFSVAAIIFTSSGQIALAVFKTEAAVIPLGILCVWFFAMTFYSLIRSVFQGFQNMPAYAGMEFFWILFVLLLAVLSVGVLGQGIRGVAPAYLVATLVVIVFAFAYLGNRYPHVFKGKAPATKPLAKKLFVFALPVFVGGLGGLILGYMDTLMLTVLRTLPEVGYYQVARPTSGLLEYLGGALIIVFFPMVSELWARRERVILNSMLHFLIKFSFLLAIPAALVFISFPEIIIRLMFGENYLAGATTLQILGGSAITAILFVILASVIAGMGKPTITAKVVGTMVCLNFVGDLLLIPPFGIEGAATATLGSSILGFVLLFYYARKLTGFTPPTSSLVKTIVGGLLTLVIIFGLKSALVLEPWTEAFVVMMLSLLFYTAWILTTKIITKDELRLIARIVPIPKWLVKVAGRFVKE